MRRIRQLAARAFTFAFAASGVALQLAGTVHLAVVQHAYCAEHGETVDVGGSAAHGGPSETAESRVERGSSEGGHSEDDAHHHCRLDEDRSTHALVVYAALLAAEPAASPELPPPHAPHARPTARVTQLLAPKTSPPA